MKIAFAVLVAVAALALPASSMAANVVVYPVKPCYRSGETVLFGGNGFTPGGRVTITNGAVPIGSLSTDGQGNIGGTLGIARRRGEGVQVYSAIDQVNPAVRTTTPLRVTAATMTVSPRSGRAGRRMRIRVRGFIGAKTLWAHLVRGRYRRNVKLGRPRGPCGVLSRRKRIFPRKTKPGPYILKVDAKRRYARSTPGLVFRFLVRRLFGRTAAEASSATRVP